MLFTCLFCQARGPTGCWRTSHNDPNVTTPRHLSWAESQMQWLASASWKRICWGPEALAKLSRLLTIKVNDSINLTYPWSWLWTAIERLISNFGTNYATRKCRNNSEQESHGSPSRFLRCPSRGVTPADFTQLMSIALVGNLEGRPNEYLESLDLTSRKLG